MFIFICSQYVLQQLTCYLFNYTILKLCDEKVFHLSIPISKVLLNKKTFIGYIRFCKLVIGINNMEFLCNVQITISCGCQQAKQL